MKDDTRLSKILVSLSCVVAVAKTDSMGEVTQLMDFMGGINVREKHLHIQLSGLLEEKAFENKSINFNMAVELQTPGALNLNCNC